MTDVPPTIEAAEAAGWEGLRVECGKPGHGVTIFPWPMLEKHAGGNRRAGLASFAGRFKCKYCGERPAVLYVQRMKGVQEVDKLQIPLPQAETQNARPSRS